MMTFASEGGPAVSPEEQSILSALRSSGGDLSVSDLIVKTALPAARLTSFLLPLEMNGMVKKLAGNRYHLLIK